MQDFNALLTVVMPVYNGEQYLEQALDSVLRQCYTNWVLKIVDDGSSDSTPEICRRYEKVDKRIVYQRFEDQRVSPAENWNRSMLSAHTQYVMMFHQDDIMHPDLLQREIEVMQTDPEIVWVSTRATFIDPTGEVIRDSKGSPSIKPATMDSWDFEKTQVFDGNKVKDLLGWRVFFNASCCMLRTDKALSIELFDKNLRLLFDAEYYARLSMLGKVGYISEQLLQYRHHETSGMSATYSLGLNGVEAVYLLRKLYASEPRVQLVNSVNKHANFALTLARIYSSKNNKGIAKMQIGIAIWFCEWMDLNKKDIVVKWFSFRFTKNRLRSLWSIILTPFIPLFKGSLPNPYNIKV